MKLAFKFLDHIKDVNDFTVLDSLTLVRGNADHIYFQLISKSSNPDIRYMPDTTATITVTFDHVDSNAVITRVASMAFPSDDRSVWKVDVLATDKLASNGMQVSLTEQSGALTREVLASSKLLIEDTGNNSRFC
jgi:hypothetical protein